MPRKQKVEGKRSVRVDLTDELYKRFEYIRDNIGIQSATDLVRFLIYQEYDRLVAKQTKQS